MVLTRALHTKAFAVTFEGDAGPIVARGRVVGDSLLILMLATGGNTPVDTQRIKLSGPILLPTIVPLAAALGESPAVGKRFTLPVFDPVGLSPRTVAFSIAAESSFVVNDSSALDRATGTWRGVQPDTLHAFRVVTGTGAGTGANGRVGPDLTHLATRTTLAALIDAYLANTSGLRDSQRVNLSFHAGQVYAFAGKNAANQHLGQQKAINSMRIPP